MQNKVTLAEIKENFSELLSKVIHDKLHLVLTRREQAVAAIIPIEQLALLEQKIQEIDLKEALESLKECREQGMLDLQALKPKDQSYDE